ncbi:hypothetical protein GCM10023235_78680 [Kitasatospora terrestris]|uniref:Sugar-binding protein n=1 Tax=Kitasatospora terrestris TaxID=258051 RepID=A0ABP9EUV8_9ACTN
MSVAVAAGPDYSRKWTPSNTALPRTKSVNGKDVQPVAVTKPAHEVPPTWQPPKSPRKAPQGHAEVRLGKAPAAAASRAAGQAPSTGSATEVSGLPVTLAPLAGSSAGEQSVGVDFVDPKTVGAAGVPGPVLKLTRGEAKSPPGPVRVSLDVSKLAESYGAGWAARARIVALPECALTTPQVAGCLQQTPVESHLDATTGRLSADVTLPGDGVSGQTRIQSVQAGTAAQPMVLAAVAGTTSGAGTYSATPLNISQAWAAGSSSGSFTYAYPIQAPSSLGGAAPQVALGYDSSSVDGKTSATNSQASWIGDGWDYSSGFVERTYQPCSKDGIAGSGDQCWAGANLTLSLAGHSGELVPDDASCQAGAAATMEQSACTWRLKGDDGSKVQFLTGASNGTWNGSYIKVTDTSGTVYYFGLAHLPDAAGNPSTKGPDSGSAWTVPVYSPNSGDPCYDSAKGKASWCQTAWRWNLDYVVDPHGNLITYTYTPEANFYARGAGQNSGTGVNSSYTRGGVLTSIGYGQLLSDQITANGAYNPAAKIVFTSDERCVTSVAACAPANRTTANAANWPDVPMDQQCASTGTCTNYGPSFWTSKWLSSITTQVRNNGTYQDVDSYALTHRFVNVVNTTESTQVPWLGSVQRTGKDTQASATAITLPPVSFTEMLLANRVDGTNLVPSRPAYNRPRIQLITTETGSTIGVDYYPADCSRTNNVMPATADTDTRSCYNVKWHQPNEQPGADPVDDWFQRYPVKTVTVNPGTPGAVPMTTAYTYGAAAWHRNDSPLTDTKDRTWDQFRGYASVTSTAGSGTDGPKSQKSTYYHQGMYGDVTTAGTRTSTVGGPKSGQVTDYDWLSGQVVEDDTFTQASGTLTAYTLNTSSNPVTTATHSRGSLPALIARYGATSTVSTSKSLKADGSWMAASTTTTTDSAHANRTLTLLSTADGVPDVCARFSYASGPDPQVAALVSEQLSVTGSNACTATPGTQNTASWKRVYYDGQNLGGLAAKAEVTSTTSIDSFNGATAVFTTDAKLTYDGYGRVLTITDPKTVDSAHLSGATVTTAYSARQAGELPNSLSVTSPAPAGASDEGTGRTTVTALDTARALPKSVTDPNGRVTTVGYDALGRTTGVWLPGRATTLSPNTAYSYAVPGIVAGKAVPPTTTTTSLVGVGTGDTYTSVSSTQIMDGLGRTMQTQSPPAVTSYHGRIISDTVYDSQGRTVRVNNPWYNDTAAPGTTLYQTTTAEVPNQTHTVYDGLGRPVTTEFVAYGVVQTATTAAYPGVDRTDLTPPTGATPTSTVTDSRGRTAQLWQYKTATATGIATDADVTTYTYTAAGLPATRKDAAGNTWTYGYDIRGRKTTSTDPDTGTSTTAYDTAGRVSSTTDARGRTITSTYDLLGRPTATYDGTAVDSSKQLTARTYDTILKGLPSTSTRYVGGAAGNAYTSAVLTYDTAYHPTKSTITIPGTEVAPASPPPAPFTYTYQAAFDPVTGLLTADNRSTVGDIAGETVSYGYDGWGLLGHYGSASTTYDLANDYDAYGRSSRTTVNPWGTQIVVTNTFDESTGRQLAQYVDKQTAATGAVQQTTYAYDPSGRITAIRSIPDNTPSATDLQCFSYDYLNRLTTAWTDTGALVMQPQPKVGGLGACANTTPTSGAVAPAKTTAGGSVPYWQDYTYDLTGNRKTLTQHDVAGDTTKDATTTQAFTSTGTVNNGNGYGGPHGLISGTTVVNGSTSNYRTYTYDAAGNTATQYSYATGYDNFTWNSEGKLDTDRPSVQIQGVGGKCLYMQGSLSTDGTPAEITSCSTSGAQKFATTGGRLKIMGKCLTPMGTTDGSAVQLQPCTGAANQTWTPRADGTILNAGTNLCLAVPGDVTTSGTDTVVNTCGTTVPAGQKWTVPDNATTYVYDADGNQLIRRNPGKNTITLGGGDELTYDTVAKTTKGTRYYQMPGGLTLVRQGTTSTWQVSDHHGTAGLALDATTLIETRRPTDPFGQSRGTQPTTWAGTHGYVGGTKDDTTGLTSLGARQYQPTTGRFINPDFILDPADPQQWNGYAYSNNNPVNLSDPSGLRPEGTCGGFGQCQTPEGQLVQEIWAPTDHGGWSVTISKTQKAILGNGVKISPTSMFKKLSEKTNDYVRDYQKKNHYVFGEDPTEDRHQWAASALNACQKMPECKNSPTFQELWEELSNWEWENLPVFEGGDVAFLTSVVGKGLAKLKKIDPRPGRESKGCPNSFPPGTYVLLADGSAKPIEDIGEGDVVLAADPENHRSGTGRVAAVIYTPDDTEFTTLSVINAETLAIGTITSTTHHPYWNEAKRRWTDAGDLKVGDRVKTTTGAAMVVAVSSQIVRAQPAYNLAIANIHTYYVLAGETPILVHNSGCFELTDIGGGNLQTPAGLIYGPMNGGEKHRIFHLGAHTAEPVKNKSNHSIFSGNASPLELVDEAWTRRGAAEPGDPGAYVVNMGRVVGSDGQMSIRIIVKPGTTEVITAYPY